MPESNPNQESFTVDVLGDVSGVQRTGKFTVKRRLSFRDQLARDNFRRSLLGPSVGDPYVRAANLAELFSETMVRIIDAPSWWKDSDNGLELEDDNVFRAVYIKTMECDVEAKRAMAEAAKKAEADLKATVAETTAQ